MSKDDWIYIGHMLLEFRQKIKAILPLSKTASW